MPTKQTDVVVIGAGVAGLTAADWLARNGMQVVRCEGGTPGGLIINVDELWGLDTESTPVSGYRFAMRLLLNNRRSGVRSVDSPVTELEAHEGSVHVKTPDDEYKARACIVASGARLKRLEVPGEAELEGRGVSQCAYCDGPLVAGRVAMVIGAGDSGMQAATRLARQCKEVHVAHRDHRPRGSWPCGWQEERPANVRLIGGVEPLEVCGTDFVQGVRLRDTATGETSFVDCAAVFVYAGLEPNTAFLPADVLRDPDGYLMADESLQTGLPNLFVAGAVRAGCGGTVAEACSDGERAAQSVLDRLLRQPHLSTADSNRGGA